MSVWFVFVFTVCVTCDSVNKILFYYTILFYLVRHYNGSESMY